MITREEFPYLQELLINDAYAVKGLRVPVFEPGQAFKHLVLTGRNGSGKTTVLQELSEELKSELNTSLGPSKVRNGLSALSKLAGQSEELEQAHNQFLASYKIIPSFSAKQQNGSRNLSSFRDRFLVAFFREIRRIKVEKVDTVISDDELTKQLLERGKRGSSTELFKQFLVNKKVAQVFDALEGRELLVQAKEKFFGSLESQLGNMFNDKKLKLEFVREKFEFYLRYSDGRLITFNQLPAGFSAFLSILADLLMRVELFREQANDYSYDPCGFVLIDEPETHLHLEMQYQILPLLTSLFPNLQFIVATHSPAVASSIKNATVFDLSTGQTMGDTAAGSSFSELMQTHFGLENEYSNVADAILTEVAEIVEMTDRGAARHRLQRLLDEQGRYMSPVLRLDVQAHLLHLQREPTA